MWSTVHRANRREADRALDGQVVQRKRWKATTGCKRSKVTQGQSSALNGVLVKCTLNKKMQPLPEINETSSWKLFECLSYLETWMRFRVLSQSTLHNILLKWQQKLRGESFSFKKINKGNTCICTMHNECWLKTALTAALGWTRNNELLIV